MKKYIFASATAERKPITELTEDEIMSLPDIFLCKTRIPGGYHGYIFNPVLKSKLIENPDKCMMIDSYWGYAHGRDIYIATRQDLIDYKKEKLDAVEREINKLNKWLIS